MAFLKNRIVLIVLCFISVIIIFNVVKPAREKEKAALTAVVRVNRIVEPNSEIKEDMLKEVTVGKYNLGKAITDKKAIIGKYSAVTLYPEENLIIENFKEEENIKDSFLYNLPEGKSAISVSIKSLAAGLSGKLQPGDIVGIEVISKQKGPNGQQTDVRIEYPELNYIEVGSITNNKAQETLEIKEKKEKSSADTIIPATATFIADEIQAEKLAEIEQIGIIHLVFKGRGEKAKALLQKNDYSKAMEPKQSMPIQKSEELKPDEEQQKHIPPTKQKSPDNFDIE